MSDRFLNAMLVLLIIIILVGFCIGGCEAFGGELQYVWTLPTENVDGSALTNLVSTTVVVAESNIWHQILATNWVPVGQHSIASRSAQAYSSSGMSPDQCSR